MMSLVGFSPDGIGLFIFFDRKIELVAGKQLLLECIFNRIFYLIVSHSVDLSGHNDINIR
jgi:hypothetical protein